jgi:membrane dipeptidase
MRSVLPLVATHSSARALCDNPRNMSDDMLRALAENGGVIQLCLLSNYIKVVPQDPKRVEALKSLEEKYSGRLETEEDRADYRKERAEINRMHPVRQATVADAVGHIDHIVDVAGIDHIGIGSDFDGGGGLADCRDASEMGNITLELVKRGYTEEEIRKIWGGNFFRVMQQAQEFAARQQ